MTDEQLAADLALSDATNERLKADLREATDTLATAMERIRELERALQMGADMLDIANYGATAGHLREVIGRKP